MEAQEVNGNGLFALHVKLCLEIALRLRNQFSKVEILQDIHSRMQVGHMGTRRCQFKSLNETRQASRWPNMKSDMNCGEKWNK